MKQNQGKSKRALSIPLASGIVIAKKNNLPRRIVAIRAEHSQRIDAIVLESGRKIQDVVDAIMDAALPAIRVE